MQYFWLKKNGDTLLTSVLRNIEVSREAFTVYNHIAKGKFEPRM